MATEMITITDIGATGEAIEALKLLRVVDQFYADPLGFVRTCFPWGEAGTALEHFPGPDEWQCQELREIGLQVQERAFDGHTPVSPIRRAVASGYGIGKSALTAWIVLWLMSTRPDSRGTVTAKTYVQLETKTWAAIQKWHKLCSTARWFVCTTNRRYHRDSKETWFCSPIYERLPALGFNNVFEVNFGLTHTPDRARANMRAYMWGEMKDWLITGAIETDEKMAMNLADPGYHINRSNLLVLESKADMQKRGQASPDDGDALALTFAQTVALPEKEEERDEDDEFGGHSRINGPGAWMR